jgi:hypothetical protein
MEEKLFSIVRNLREYGYYKKSDANAAKILRKAFPGIGRAHHPGCDPRLMISMMGYFIVHWHLER